MPEQRARVEAVMARMRNDAQNLGEKIIEAERHLDMRFLHKHIDRAGLAEKTAEIGRLQGELRRVHLEAHLDTVSILSPEQVAAYNASRGYGAAGHGQHKN
jgi:Spy/CpxP family protein refolding chaperone